jgi:hypothetical protein
MRENSCYFHRVGQSLHPFAVYLICTYLQNNQKVADRSQQPSATALQLFT